MDSYEPYGNSPEPRRAERDDYVYRERRRSPAPDRRRQERRRSRSPAAIDRYQPADRLPRDDYYGTRGRDERERDRDNTRRDRRHSSPQPPPGNQIDRYVPGQEILPQVLLVNPLPDPMKLDFQVGFTWFAEWWRTDQRIKEEKERVKHGRPPPRVRGDRESREEREADRPKIQAAYDQYKEALQKNQAQTFVRLHKHEDWFRERYVPEVRDAFRERLDEFRRRELFRTWNDELQAGTFDDFTLEGIYKSESNGLGGILEKEEGETTAAAEVLGVGDLLPSRGGDLRDSVAMQPTLLIKTIAPTVTREKFEAFAKEHLGEADGGYKWLSLSDPNPLKKCHRMGWIMLNPEDETDVNPSETEPRERGEMDAEDGEADEIKLEPGTTLLSTSDRALEKINGKTIEDPERGNFTVHCGVHRPPEAPRKKALWDLFSAPERIERDLELATRLVQKLDGELGEEFSGLARIEQKVEDMAGKGWLQPPITGTSKPIKRERDPDDIEEGEDETMEDGEEDEGMVEEDEADDEDLIIKKKKLDLIVEYLRRVYNFCFFCVFESDSVHELQRKCPGGHLRRPRNSLTSAAKATAKASASGEPFPLKKSFEKKDSVEEGEMEGSPVAERKDQFSKPNSRNAQQLQRAYNWVKTFEEKILQLLEPENVNLKKIGGQPAEEALEEELNKFVKQEDMNKWRCKVPECTKLFKAESFWRKHIEKRHPDWYERVKTDVDLVNTYVLDPAHIAPSRSDANSNGHFPLNNMHPTGTPRGFNLNNQFPMGFPMGAGMPNPMTPGGTTFPNPMFQQGPLAMPTNWGPPGADFGMHQGGPMRQRTFQGNGARMPGPYDRTGRGGMGMRTPSFGDGGRGRMGSMSGRGSMLEGGAATLGPREAVQGRSLKSYEDLDAAGGLDGTAELNY